MTYTAEFEQWVPFSLDQVFLFFANPENLPRIMPPATDTRIDALALVSPRTPFREIDTSHLAGVGSKIVTSFRAMPPLPFRALWIARITEFEWNHHFADVQEKGPFKSFHHRHEFATQENDDVRGTIVRDRLSCDIGFGPAGRVAQYLFVERQLASAFFHRQKALLTLLSTPTSK